MKKLSSKITAVLFASCISLNTFASTITVNWDGTGDFLAIQDGIDTAVYGDTINVMSGTYLENIELKNGISIIGVSAEDTIIDGNGNGSVVISNDCDPNTVLSRVRITNGEADYGAGISNTKSSPTITYCSFSKNLAYYGGGMLNLNHSNPIVSHCTFSGNRDSISGGGMLNYDYSSPIISHCSFNDNEATGGGGIHNYNDSNPILDNCVFDNNWSWRNGGGVYNFGSSPKLANCIFKNNSAYNDGGGMLNNESDPILVSCSFFNNSARDDGGAVSSENYSNPVFSKCNFDMNLSPGSGGGIHLKNQSDAIIEDCEFINNHSGKGGAVYISNSRHSIITDCVFTNNLAVIRGGGIYCGGYSSAIVYSCDFTGNDASIAGGGIFSSYSNMEINNCIFIGNSSLRSGGGLLIHTKASTVMNCLFAGNIAGEDGGALFDISSSSLIINNTFYANSAGQQGGGILIRKSSPTITNCILSENSSLQGYQVYADFNSHPLIDHSNMVGGMNIPFVESDSESSVVDAGNNIDDSPLFIDPNSGNYQLSPQSPCIDMGDPDSEFQSGATDLDGNPRVDNGVVDMGAYEFIHPVKVSVDIKPQTCPNPVNVKSKGILPVAILGSDVLDVNDIDLDTILLEGVAPLRGSYEDVASPVIDGTECACTLEGADGYVDLSLKFDSQAILSVLGEVADNEVWMLYLTGYLKDGTPIEGADCIIIKKKGK